jgi:predicted amidophosphoribosyltransferase
MVKVKYIYESEGFMRGYVPHCGNCNIEVDIQDNYCRNCGAKLDFDVDIPCVSDIESEV